MYSKIAAKNVKKSFKDYTIYFLTLTLAVCIFYSFNSIKSQKILMDVSSIDMMDDIMAYISVFVSIILGGLILYANNFLIKKRNKELGIYMTLGMGKSKISKILIIETIIVGAVSLLSGLILGVFASQGLSILVAKLFEVSMSEYEFTISLLSMNKTVLYFGIMFLIVMVFNTYIISKYKIIDLLTVGRKTEEIKFKNPFVYLVTFILCVISLASAYTLILEVGLRPADQKFLWAVILGAIGTVLFFYSLAGFVLYIIKKNKKVYFKGLNIFVVKQINSKVNTNFLSMSVICLMLFLTITILSTGFSFKQALEAGLKESTPFDASAYLYVYEGDKLDSIKTSFENMDFEFNKNDKVAYYNEYQNGAKISDILNIKDKMDFDFEVSYVKISEFNEIRKLEGQEPVNLSNNEVLITGNNSTIVPRIKKYMKENNTIKIDSKVYNIKNENIIEHNLKSDFAKNNMLTIIINDEFCEKLPVSMSNVNINFANENKKESEEKFTNLIDLYTSNDTDLDYDKVGVVFGSTRDKIYEENKGVTTVVLFVGIYLGIVFLISSMAVLALQQLSEASDSIDRYTSLKKLGASKNSINKTIFTQTLIYFTIPIVLAVIHSIVGIKVANDFITMYNQVNIGGSALMTAGILISIYGIYFYTTYQGYKNIVMNKI